MNRITVLEDNFENDNKINWHFFLSCQKILVEQNFDWLKLILDAKNKQIIGSGELLVDRKKISIILSYSPFNHFRYDRIYITDQGIKYHRDIHLYSDKSLCLYHPKIDQPLLERIPLVKMIPWITEWVIFYEQWKKYGVWLGKEIKH